MQQSAMESSMILKATRGWESRPPNMSPCMSSIHSLAFGLRSPLRPRVAALVQKFHPAPPGGSACEAILLRPMGSPNIQTNMRGRKAKLQNSSWWFLVKHCRIYANCIGYKSFKIAGAPKGGDRQWSSSPDLGHDMATSCNIHFAIWFSQFPTKGW